MKTKLTLRSSSMLFLGVNLLRNVPTEADSDTLSPAAIRILNQYIKSGAVESTEGLFPTEAPKEVEEEQVAAVEVEAPVEVLVPVEVAEPKVEEIVEVQATEEKVEAEEAPVEKTATPKRKTASKKKA